MRKGADQVKHRWTEQGVQADFSKHRFAVLISGGPIVLNNRFQIFTYEVEESPLEYLFCAIICWADMAGKQLSIQPFVLFSQLLRSNRFTSSPPTSMASIMFPWSPSWAPCPHQPWTPPLLATPLRFYKLGISKGAFKDLANFLKWIWSSVHI